MLPSQEIEVGAADLKNISLQVPGIRLSGRVVAPGGATLPKLNYVRVVRSGDSTVAYGFPDSAGQFSLLLAPGEYRVFTESLGALVRSVSDGSRDITNMEFNVDGASDQRIVVTLEK